MESRKVTGLGTLPQINAFDSIPDFTRAVHVRENSGSNEAHLNTNRQKFTGQCAIVLSLLQKGIVLSSRSAMLNYDIGHLARRIKDLRDECGIDNIEDQFEYDKSGKITRNKIWFIREVLSEETMVRHKIDWKKNDLKH